MYLRSRLYTLKQLSSRNTHTLVKQAGKLTTMKPSLLICGVGGGSDGGGAKPENNAAPNLIMSDIKKLRDEGHEVTVQLIDTSAPFGESNEKFKNAVAGKKFDGVSIGFGIRGVIPLTPLFEDLVNTVFQEIKPPPKMIFTETVDSLYVAVRRAFPKED